MSNARIVVRDNASDRVYGPAEILDAEGSLILFVPEGAHAALCRCGMSENKPFCDSSHKHHGFEDCVRAAAIADPQARFLKPVNPDKPQL
ncbi:MAG: CDGSH iron-sulfur domain-containing protein [Candidatus Dormibacteraeota bacterium]|nr:CDGSH iron-sulfur domain-containing protein [Candidatus Dormibacteraeota bacterium]